MSLSSVILVAASLLPAVLARTDLTGCTSTDVSSPAGASLAWYVPGTGELCDFLDCGGGRAPNKDDVPGCPGYTGTASYSPSFMPGWGSATATPTAMAASDYSSRSASAPTSTITATAPGAYTSGYVVPVTWPTDSLTLSSAWSSYAAASGDSSWSSAASGDSSWASASLMTSQASLYPSGSVTPIVAPYPITSSNTTLTTVVGSTGAVLSGSTASTSGSASGTSGASATAASSSPSSVTAANSAETARVWLGSAVMVGLGAVVVAL